MRISDWSSDVCSSDLFSRFTRSDGAGPHCGSTCISSPAANRGAHSRTPVWNPDLVSTAGDTKAIAEKAAISRANQNQALRSRARSLEPSWAPQVNMNAIIERSEEHTSELQSLMRISYSV